LGGFREVAGDAEGFRHAECGAFGEDARGEGVAIVAFVDQRFVMGGSTAVTAGRCAGGCGGKLGGEGIFAGATMGDERHGNQSEEGASR